MPTLRTLAASFLALLAGCQARESAPAAAQLGPPAVAPRPAVDTSRVAIFPYDARRDQYIFQNAGPLKATALSMAEFAIVDSLLAACVKEYNQAQAVELEDMRKVMHKDYFAVQLHEERYLINLANYKRQLITVTNAKSEKVVWINCFYREGSHASWRHQLIEVDDGGNCYFNIKLNLTRRTWYDVMVNGVA
ncbi:hypothetical protein [Hymenobacter coccineus]|uniref:Lipoprotein n=1 Tax=Hymenobacter coccineus TaxID=1908235 RepID=A0A1G1TIW3_9BACT|nr:hypothetical protein [Hymenobacter coccineus]OGX90799.1 hypothetical protein BEN49_00440 [Hymenobacter coccineus]